MTREFKAKFKINLDIIGNFTKPKEKMMKLLLARNELDKKPAQITLDEISAKVESGGGHIFYFDKDNTDKELLSLIDYFDKKGLSVYHRKVKYGLEEGDYMYEVHIL